MLDERSRSALVVPRFRSIDRHEHEAPRAAGRGGENLEPLKKTVTARRTLVIEFDEAHVANLVYEIVAHLPGARVIESDHAGGRWN